MATKEQKLKQEIRQLKQEIRQWKETCEIVRDKDIMKSIQISLKQLAQGKGIPLAQLKT